MNKDEALKLALEFIERVNKDGWILADFEPQMYATIAAIKEALAQEQDNTYTYASSLATAIWQKHYIKDSPKWKPLDTTEGVLTQIDNMTCGLVKEKPAQPEQEQEPAQPVQPADTAKLYEELRSIIDGGSEVFTHADAVQYLKDNLAPLKWTPEDTAYRPGGMSLTDWEAVAADQALTIALMKVEQEPFGYLWATERHPEFRFTKQSRNGVEGKPLYASPPQRQPLTSEEIEALIPQPVLRDERGRGFGGEGSWDRVQVRKVARAIEAAHGIKE